MKTFNITYEQNGNSFVKGIHIEATSFGEMEEKFNRIYQEIPFIMKCG